MNGPKEPSQTPRLLRPLVLTLAPEGKPKAVEASSEM
jgi:hypothetical protein